MPKPTPLTFQVVTTEFWRNSYPIPGESAADALVMYDCLKLTGALPNPARSLLGVIEPPEQVISPEGKLVHDHPPDADDAERFLMLQMWSRMKSTKDELNPAMKDGAWLAILASVRFICDIRKWDFQETLKEVLA